jgi:hypothetical protein
MELPSLLSPEDLEKKHNVVFIECYLKYRFRGEFEQWHIGKEVTSAVEHVKFMHSITSIWQHSYEDDILPSPCKMADYSVGQILHAVVWILVSDQAGDTLNMRECCGGPKHARSLSAPKILIPSEVSIYILHKTDRLPRRQTEGLPDSRDKWTVEQTDRWTARHTR